MTDEVTVRPMRWWDVEAVLPFERDLFGAQAWSTETWWGELAQVGAEAGAARWYIVAQQFSAGGAAILGYAGLSVNRDQGEVMTIAVASAGQGRGLGARLLRELLNEAAGRGVQEMLLEVRADNEAAQRLYRRFGFEQIARRPGYYGDVDALILRLRPVPGRGSGPASGLNGPRDDGS